MNNNVLSSKYVLLIAIMLSAMMLAASPIVSLVPTTVFAQEDSDNVDVGEGDVEVDPVTQTNVQTDVNTNVDTAVVTEEEDCDEASNDVDQEISQPSDQQVSRDVEVGEGGLYVNPVVQTSVQAGFNTNVDYDVILAEGCEPVDNTNQETLQSSDQQANRDIEGEGSSDLVLTSQRADQIAQNRQLGEDILIEAPLPQ